jgi:hypothetical protein
MRIDRATLLGLTLVGAALLVMVASFYLAWRLADPHIAGRGGALISAMAAGAILYQILYEVQLEDSRRALEVAPSTDPEPIRPIDQLAERLLERERKLAMAALTTRRLRLASYVVSCAISGELLHGFGDLIFCSLLHCGH